MNRIASTSSARWLTALTLALSTAIAGHADVWDEQTLNDDSPATRQELVHGSNELHDLAAKNSEGGPAADEDWFRLLQRGRSSYEVVVERSSGDACPVELSRVAADGATTVQTSKPVGLGCTRSLRWMTGAGSVGDQFIRVGSEACGTSCGKDDTYRLRAYETTYAVPRFNNTGTQVSILFVQNTSAARVTGTVHFWRTDGSLAGSHDFSLSPRASLVLNTSTVVPGSSGAATVANDGRYGDLTGKITGLEPTTGFSFDTLMVPRPI